MKTAAASLLHRDERCVGSCVGGPVMEKYHRFPVRDYMQVSQYAGEKDSRCCPCPPRHEKAMGPSRRHRPATEARSPKPGQMGKTGRSRAQLRSCGIILPGEAVPCPGKADISMCSLPDEPGESFSDISSTIHLTPSLCSTRIWRCSRSTRLP